MRFWLSVILVVFFVPCGLAIAAGMIYAHCRTTTAPSAKGLNGGGFDRTAVSRCGGSSSTTGAGDARNGGHAPSRCISTITSKSSRDSARPDG